MAKVLIVCGGTGGHLTPGIAVAEELSFRGHDCVLVVSQKSVDARLVQNYPAMEFVEAPGAPFSWNPVAFLKFLWIQMTAFVYAVRLLSKRKPDLVLGFGGFLTAGIAIPGKLKGIPFALHEANRVVGRSNRLLSKFCDRIFLPAGVHLPGVPADRIQHFGLPLRKEFVSVSQTDARSALDIRPANKLLVVFGGSQGARSLNNWVEESYSALAQRGISVYCLSGLQKTMPGEVMTDTESFGPVPSWFVPFSDNMPAVLSAADAVVSRAGAGSIGEIIRCRAPAILVPYPYARDDHQTANAQYLVEREAAFIVEDDCLDRLLEEVIRLLFDETLIQRLRENLGQLDKPDEVRRLGDELEHMVGSKQIKEPASTLPPKEV